MHHTVYNIKSSIQQYDFVENYKLDICQNWFKIIIKIPSNQSCLMYLQITRKVFVHENITAGLENIHFTRKGISL